MTNPPVDVDPPLSLEPVVGWRAWGLDRVGGELSLRSVTRPDHWPAREAMVARCLQHRAGTVPDWHCTCGLYAVASPEHLARSGVLGDRDQRRRDRIDVGTDHRAHVRSPISVRLSGAAPARVRTMPCPRRRSRDAGEGPGRTRIAHGRLRSALVRSGGSCRPRRRRRGGTPVNVRRGAVADRTALGRPPRLAGTDPTATRPVVTPPRSRRRVPSSRRPRPSARTPGGSSPACTSSLVSSVASSNRPQRTRRRRGPT